MLGTNRYEVLTELLYLMYSAVPAHVMCTGPGTDSDCQFSTQPQMRGPWFRVLPQRSSLCSRQSHLAQTL